MDRHGQITGGILLPQNILELVRSYGEEWGSTPRARDFCQSSCLPARRHGGRAALEQIQSPSAMLPSRPPSAIMRRQ